MKPIVAFLIAFVPSFFPQTPEEKGVINPHVKTDKSVDFQTIDSIINSVVKDGMSNEEKVLAMFHVIRRNFVHGPPPRDIAYDFHRIQHSVGVGACLTMTTPLKVIYERMGYKCQSWVHNTHHMIQVHYDGDWHCLDPHMNFFCYDRSKQRKIASVKQLRADPTLAFDAASEGRAIGGYLLCGDSPGWFASQKDNPDDNWYLESDGRWPQMTIEEPFGSITFCRGETYIRTWQPGKYWYKASWPENYGCGPIHTCGTADRKDSANWALYEPHGCKPGIGEHANQTFYRIWGVGRLEYRPELASGHYKDACLSETNVEIAGDALAQADTSKPGEILLKIQCPYVITAGELKLRSNEGKVSATVSVDNQYVSKTLNRDWQIPILPLDLPIQREHLRSTDNGKTWKPVQVGVPFTDEVNGSWSGYLLKLTLTDGAAIAKLELISHFQLNRYSLPYLVPGKNLVSVSAERYFAPLTVEYRWFDGKDWNTPESARHTFTKDGQFEIEVAGPKYPRMTSLAFSVAP